MLPGGGKNESLSTVSQEKAVEKRVPFIPGAHRGGKPGRGLARLAPVLARGNDRRRRGGKS